MSARVRPTVVAGRFYPGDADRCRAQITDLLPATSDPAAVGALVPHAGWIFSGRLAARGIAAVARAKPETVVVFGAVHRPRSAAASVYATGSWQTPLGALPVDEPLAAAFVRCRHIVDSPADHAAEHAIEVQVPIIQHLLPNARLVPVGVQPGPHAPEIGRFCAAAARDSGKSIGFLGSTDLTHYGPAFGFEPHGHGAEGVRWAKEVNDQRFIDLVAGLQADAVVAEASAHGNACGSGAVAALIAAMQESGATRYIELEHTCSAEIPEGPRFGSADSVGYEVGIFVRPD
jgi:AmmeMemoRadiSam system protein B